MNPRKRTIVIFAALSVSLALSDDFKAKDGKEYKDANPTSHALVDALKGRNNNPAGAISGAYIDSSGALHSFILTPDNTFTSFDAAVAGAGSGQGAQSEKINPPGVLSGAYIDSSSVLYGFVLTPDGVCTSAPLQDAHPGPPAEGNPACIPACLKPTGPTTGEYIDASNVFHGFIRTPDGTIISFDAPGAGTGPGQGTMPTGINSAGMIQGTYIDSCSVNHNFLRAADGVVTTFDARVAGIDTAPETIDTSAVAEWYIDSSGVFHGFALAKNGALTTFDVPGANTGLGQGRNLFRNNLVGGITGWYIDSSGVFQSFLRSR